MPSELSLVMAWRRQTFIEVRLVEDGADARFQLLTLFDHVTAGHRGAALRGVDLAGECADGSAFAGAVWAEQTKDLAVRHAKADARHRLIGS